MENHEKPCIEYPESFEEQVHESFQPSWQRIPLRQRPDVTHNRLAKGI